MIICPDCGKEASNEKFCRNCGAYLGDVEEIEVIKTQSDEDFEENSLINRSYNFKFCYNCGAKLSDNSKFCPECGQDLRSNIIKNNSSQISSKEKNTSLAVILSVLLPGLGQIYLGLDNKGSIFLIAYIISVILILLIIGFLFVIIIWIWALVDTIISVNTLNRGEEVIDKLF